MRDQWSIVSGNYSFGRNASALLKQTKPGVWDYFQDWICGGV